MQPGLWEVTFRVEVAGRPAEVETLRRCVTPEQVKEAASASPAAPRGDCTVSDYKATAEGASWTFDCKGGNPMTGSGSIVWQGASYSGATRVETREDGRPIVVNQSYSGVRIGDCAPPAARTR
ncbi:MAG: DUF3617 domain-containing protein [Burkholderiales bacterium]|nr:DUF3617 domain-containing protein [Burkholderiales bacterium]